MFYEGLTKEEIEAYRELESNATFDFGEGPMRMGEEDFGYGSEDAYYEMDLQNLLDESLSNDSARISPQRKSGKNTVARRKRRLQKKKKTRKAKEQFHFSLLPVFTYRQGSDRIYNVFSKYQKTKKLKKTSNKSVRRYSGNLSSKGDYKKIFPYIDTLI